MRKLLLILLLGFTFTSTAQVMLPAYQGVFSRKILSPGSASNGLDFDGIDDYVLLPKPTLNNMTIEYWVNTSESSLNGSQWYSGSGIVDAEVGGGTTDFGTSLLNGKLAFGVGQPDVTIQSITSINTGVWHHVAATWNGSTGEMKIYINGLLEVTGTGATGTRTAPSNIRIGSLQTGIQYFKGKMDDVRIWNTTRTQAQIQANMNIELLGTESSLVAYYQFNQGIAAGNNSAISTVTDKTVNGFNGTITNFAKSGATSNFVLGKVISN